MLQACPTLSRVVACLDGHLQARFPDFFGEKPKHPFLRVKPYKVIHDGLWGTNRFSWRELAVIDSPFYQRLRTIRQVGLAYYVYPSAQHSRFEHSLGVVTVASKVFDALLQRHLADIQTIAAGFNIKVEEFLARLREELRMAALVHDVGHSIYSHASEQVYQELPLLQNAVLELHKLIGKKKGAGEVISFCFSRTTSLKRLLDNAEGHLPSEEKHKVKSLVWDNVSLLIVGRSAHPYLQWMGDIISSDLDADKLDYLLRDALAAGLPLRYDLERYLYTVGLAKDVIPDGDGYLEGMYKAAKGSGDGPPPRVEASGAVEFPHYESYRLRLPRNAVNTVEQIVICKFMLFSYIYHHRKVRAAEGMLGTLLRQVVAQWKAEGKSDEDILRDFLQLDDSSLGSPAFAGNADPLVSGHSLRIAQRVLPREVYGFVASKFSHAEGGLLSNFMSILLDREPAKREAVMKRFHEVMGAELLKLSPGLGKTGGEALRSAGAWLDAPKPPKFENINLILGSSGDRIPLSEVFPIRYWIQAYESHRYTARVFAFCEYVDKVAIAARLACEEVIGAKTDSFFHTALRSHA
jgi:HD superfamily phosphohydrolase